MVLWITCSSLAVAQSRQGLQSIDDFLTKVAADQP